MATVAKGSQVKVHYQGTLSDGSVFDSSYESDPLEFTVGEGHIIPGFERSVEGMAVDEEKTFTLTPDDAYGQKRDDLIFSFPKEKLPEDINPEPGQQLQMTDEKNRPFAVTVTKVDADQITLDANPPLAGKDLTFRIKLVDIVN
jgi:peptidylprolyl isomerase